MAILADGIGSTHGVTRTIEEIRSRGVSGYEIEVVATDPEVDRRLSAVAEIDVPYYPGLRIGVPSLPAAVQTLADGAFGGGPEQERLRERVSDAHTTFLGWLSGSDLARAYASADILLFPSATDTFGQVILEAQASGLPVIAVAQGGPPSLIEHRVSGLLCEADAGALAEAVLELRGSPLLRERLTVAGLASARGRTWKRALERLGEGYARVLSAGARDGAHADEVPRAA